MPSDVMLPAGFLLSNWYSGATLLTMLLSKHPDVVTNGELFPGRKDGKVKDVTCSCGELLTACSFYRSAARHMWTGDGYDPALFRWVPRWSRVASLQRVLETTRLVGRRRVRARNLFPQVTQRTAAFLAAQRTFMWNALEETGGTSYIDGCKSIARAELFLWHVDMHKVPIVLLVRDPLSWTASWMNKRPRATVSNAISTWCEYIRRAQRVAESFPQATLHFVRYEELCLEPSKILKGVCAAFGLVWDPALTEERPPVEHHILGNDMRLTFDGHIRPPRDRSHELPRGVREKLMEGCEVVARDVGYTW